MKLALKLPERPIIEQGSTDNEWVLFVDSWNQYEYICGLKDLVAIWNELYLFDRSK